MLPPPFNPRTYHGERLNTIRVNDINPVCLLQLRILSVCYRNGSSIGHCWLDKLKAWEDNIKTDLTDGELQ
jgi:hypothetical protein